MNLTELINKIDEIVKNEPPDEAVRKILSLPENRATLITALSYLLVIYANKKESQSLTRKYPREEWKND